MRVQYQIVDPRLGKEFTYPSYENTLSAGMDLIACIDGPINLVPGQSKMIGTGIRINISDSNIAAMIVPNPQVANHRGLVLENLIGIINSGFDGAIYLSAWNRTIDTLIHIDPGDRLAQLIFIPVIRPILEHVTVFEDNNKLGANRES